MKHKLVFVGDDSVLSFVLSQDDFNEMREHGIGICIDCGKAKGSPQRCRECGLEYSRKRYREYYQREGGKRGKYEREQRREEQKR